jgi:hypothetical protein
MLITSTKEAPKKALRSLTLLVVWEIWNERASKKALRSLTLLVVWEIWNERNRRTFQQKELLSNSLLTKIKEEARAWILAGAKHLGNWLIT